MAGAKTRASAAFFIRQPQGLLILCLELGLTHRQI